MRSVSGGSRCWLVLSWLAVFSGGCSLSDPTISSPDGSLGGSRDGGTGANGGTSGGGASNGGLSNGGTSNPGAGATQTASGGTASVGGAGASSGGAEQAGSSGSGGNTGSGGTTGSAGKDGGSDMGPDAGDGGASNGGMHGAGGGGTGGTTVGSVGDACSPNASLACAGHAQAGKLICTSAKWASNGTCATGSNCDTRAGAGAGSCVTVVPECKSKSPADTVCNGQTAEVCGPDLVTVNSSVDCTKQGQAGQACVNGTCQGVCVPGTKQCGTGGVQTCSAAGTWDTATACPASAPTCSGAGNCTCSTATVCSGVCVDEQTSKANCGGCGLACPNACGGGRCVVPLDGGDQGLEVATDGFSVFWVAATDHSIHRVGINAAAPKTIYTPPTGMVASGLFMDSQFYFVTNKGGAIASTDTSGSVQLLDTINGGATAIATMRNIPTRVTATPTFLYWTESSQIIRYDRGSGAITPFVPNLMNPIDVNEANASLYYALQNGGKGNGSVASVPIAGGTPTTLSSGLMLPLSIGADAQNVYVMDFDAQISGTGNSLIRKVPVGGGTTTTLASNIGTYFYSNIAVDDTYVYWADWTNGAIKKVAKTGGTVTTLVDALTTPAWVVVRDDSVYFTHALGVSKVTPK